MILLTIILLSIVALVGFAVVSIVLGAGGFIVIFGDVIICAAFIVFVVRQLLKKK